MRTSRQIRGFLGARRLTVLTVASLVLAPVSVVAASTAPASAAGAASSNLAPGSYRPVPGARLLDTRVGNGAPKAAVLPRGRVVLQVTGRGAVPSSGVSAVQLNLTVTGATSGGYLTVYPAGTSAPLASNLNFTAGHTVANSVLVKLGAGGAVVVANGSSGTAQLIVDVQGYYLAGTPATSGAFASLAPTRVLDTRTGLGASRRAVSARQTLALSIAGHGGVPVSGVGAVVLNLTVAGPTARGYLTAYPGGPSRPDASNVNFATGQTVAALVTVQVGSDGTVNLYNGSAGTTQLIADVAGYYRAGIAATAGAYTPISPLRLVDSRTGSINVTAGSTNDVLVGNTPASMDVDRVSAVVLTLTVTGASQGGYLSLAGSSSSILNWRAGQTVANQVVVPIGYGAAALIHNASKGKIGLIVDLSGYFEDPDLSWSSTTQADPWHTAFANLSCASATFCLAADQAGNVATYDGASWSPLQQIDPPAELEFPSQALAVSCPTSSFCMVADGHGKVLMRTGTTWSMTLNISGGHALRSISCASASLCVAVDDDGTVWTFNGQDWSVGTSIGGDLRSVACPSTTMCLVANGSGGMWALNGFTWAPSAGSPTGQDAVACSSPTFCIAGGTSGRVSRFNGSTWSPADVVDSSGGTIVSASCGSATSCVVGEASGRAAVWNGTSWTTPSTIDASAASPIRSISCGSPTTCLAVDSTAVITRTGSSWSAPTHPQVQNTIAGLSCATPSFCAAVDQEGKALTYDGTSWSTPLSLGGPTPVDVSCASATFCVAVGGSAAYSFDGSHWSAPVAVDVGQILSVVSCPTAMFCLAADRAGGTVTFDGTSWTPGPAAGSVSEPVTSLSCPSPDFCAAGVGNGGFVTTYTNGAWTVLPDGLDPQYSLSCASESFCAAGGYQLGDVMDGTFPGRFGPAQPVLPASITSLSCPSVSFCLAADNYGNLAIYNGATWTVNVNNPAYPSLQAGAKVSCATPDFCLVLGTFGGVSAVGMA